MTASQSSNPDETVLARRKFFADEFAHKNLRCSFFMTVTFKVTCYCCLLMDALQKQIGLGKNSCDQPCLDDLCHRKQGNLCICKALLFLEVLSPQHGSR